MASSFAAYHLLEEYQRASAALQTSIEELRVSTEKVSIGWNTCYWTPNNSFIQVSAHVRRIEAVEKDLKALSDASASKEDISRVRAEVKKIYDGLHIGKQKNWNFMIIQSEFSIQSSWIYEHMCGECVSEILLSENTSALTNSKSQSIEQDLHKLLKNESSTEV